MKASYHVLVTISAVLFFSAIFLFATSWWWMPSKEIELRQNQFISVDSRFGRFSIQEIIQADQGWASEQGGAETTEQELIETAKSIDQQVQNGDIEVIALTPAPWYSFLLFDSEDYENEELREIGFETWRWIEIPYWSVILATGILPAAWLIGRHKTRQRTTQDS